MVEFEKKFRDNYSVYETFTKRLEELLKVILDGAGIKYHLIESRTKSIDGFVEKIQRKQGKYKDPLVEITDLSALRIIVFYIEDLEKVAKILEENFEIDKANSFDAINNLRENQFGYLSSHFVLSLKSDRTNLPEWKLLEKLKAEIQVRTVLQHSWAAISHELEYKKSYEIPSILKRKLFRLASLIELADEEFQEVKEKHSTIEISILQKKPVNNVNVYEEINLQTIQSYFREIDKSQKKIVENAVSAGFDIGPIGNKGNDYLSGIIEIANILNIKTLPDFKKKMIELAKKSAKTLKELYEINPTTKWTVSREFLVLLLLITELTKENLQLYNKTGWSDNIWTIIEGYVIANSK